MLVVEGLVQEAGEGDGPRSVSRLEHLYALDVPSRFAAEFPEGRCEVDVVV